MHQPPNWHQFAAPSIASIGFGLFDGSDHPFSLGSATVAGLTTAGIFAPARANGLVNPQLMVLSIGAGSLAFSHINDSGFWVYKEYFNLNMKDTLRSYSLMETIVSVVGMSGVLLLNLVV